MSWGTSFDANIYISKMHFQSKQDVENKKADINKELINIENILFGYICANPSEIVSEGDKDNNNVIEALRYKFNELLEDYTHNLITSYELDLLEENFDTKTED